MSSECWWNAAVLEDFADYRAGVKIPTLGPADLGAMDKGPFSSLVTGRASRSSSHTLTIRVKCLEPLGPQFGLPDCPGLKRGRFVCAHHLFTPSWLLQGAAT
jgi:hypothetical protein